MIYFGADTPLSNRKARRVNYRLHDWGYKTTISMCYRRRPSEIAAFLEPLHEETQKRLLSFIYHAAYTSLDRNSVSAGDIIEMLEAAPPSVAKYAISRYIERRKNSI